MSQVNIEGLVNSIKRESTAYVPVVEAIANSIDAIDKSSVEDGTIDIILELESNIQKLADPQIENIIICDNGIGFTAANRESFDTLFSTLKRDAGGKGFGRVFFLKHFNRTLIKSTYRDAGVFRERSFEIGRQKDFIINESNGSTANRNTGTEVRLIGIKSRNGDFQTNDIEMFSHRLLQNISEADKSNLAKYMALRRLVLTFFDRALQCDEDGEFEQERKLHSIIFPVGRDSDSISEGEHNLWVIDERLNFVQHINSDKRGFNGSYDRPDLTAFHYPVSYREGENKGNPVSIFEFKRPGRYDFARFGSSYDPITQIIRYARQMHEGNARTPKGKSIQVSDTTPFYGYVIASANGDVRKWLEEEKNMKLMPDGGGWYYYHDNLNLKNEFITWDKLLQDAELRHRRFFEKLGL